MPNAMHQHFEIALDRADALRMTCVNANCEAERGGWWVMLDPLNEQHRGAANYILNDSGRRFLRFNTPAEALDQLDTTIRAEGIAITPATRAALHQLPRHFVVFAFPPGQQCFKPHLDREVHFLHRVGDRVREHTRGVDWNEHMNEESYRIERERQKG